MFNIRALARGAAAPLRSPRKTVAPAAFAVRDFARFRLAERPGGQPLDVLLPTTDYRRSWPSVSRVSLRHDRRKRGRCCHRFGAGPPGLRDGLRPSLRRGRAPFPTQQGPVVRDVTRPGPALDEETLEDGSDVREIGVFHTLSLVGGLRWSTTSTAPPLFCLASVGRRARFPMGCRGLLQLRTSCNGGRARPHAVGGPYCMRLLGSGRRRLRLVGSAGTCS